jgi:hypothetical protein
MQTSRAFAVLAAGATALLCALPERSPAAAETALTVSMPVAGTDLWQDLGKADVAGVGKLTFSGRRTGNRLEIKVADVTGKLVGNGESLIGLAEMPIYIESPQGLMPFTLRWKGNTAGGTYRPTQ